MIAFEYMLLKNGLLNSSVEDLGVIASATPRNPYKVYCTSRHCCAFKVEKNSKGKIRYVTQIKPRVLKYEGYNPPARCQDCNHFLLTTT